MKRFTIEEAEALIPELEKIFEAVAELAAQAQARADQAQRLEDRQPGAAAEIQLAKSQVQFLTRQMEQKLHAIVELGAVPKGLDPALVDFPARVGGEDVFLCWKFGEKAITAYHGADDGFAGRKPLPKRPRPS